MSHALVAIQNTLQNSNIFIRSRETVIFTPFGKKKVTQFSGLPPISVSYLKSNSNGQIFNIRQNINCQSENVVYLIWCEECKLQI